MIKILLIVVSIVTGYYLPNYPIKSLHVFVAGILLALYLGWETPYMMNKESLLMIDDSRKATFRTRITLRRKNTHGLWIGICFCVMALTRFFKSELLYHEFSKLGLFLLAFGLPAIIRVYDFRPTSKKS
jgi:hypothetical protein